MLFSAGKGVIAWPSNGWKNCSSRAIFRDVNLYGMSWPFLSFFFFFKQTIEFLVELVAAYP